MAGPLDGIKILDFTRYQQGPYATVMLSDLGAEVLKVEPREGDPGRSLGLKPDGWCAYFEAHDRNKRSMTIDVRKPEGKAIVYKLVEEYDVVTDNFRPAVMGRLGLDWESLSKVNPRVITATATGFGPEGPYAHRPSFDSIGQAMGGIMYVQGRGAGGAAGGRDGRNGGPGGSDGVRAGGSRRRSSRGSGRGWGSMWMCRCSGRSWRCKRSS